MTSMPSKLESSLKTHPDVVLRNAENLVRAGLSFDTFVIEGDAGETHLASIWRKAGLRKWRGVDLDSPKTWKARTASSAPKTSSD
jgi:hypothetical protein